MFSIHLKVWWATITATSDSYPGQFKDYVQPSKEDPKIPKLTQQPAEPTPVAVASAPQPTPRDLLQSQAFIDHQRKQKGYVPTEAKIVTIVENYKNSLAQLNTFQKEANQANRTYQALEAQSQPSFKNLFGLLNNKTQLEKVREHYDIAESKLEYYKRQTFNRYESSFQDAKDAFERYIKWDESPETERMRRIQAKLTEPALQERLKEAQMMDQAFNEWQKDASRLKRSPDYRQKIQQINEHYLETGEFPTEKAVNAMQQDFKQADQLTAQVERSYGDS